MSIREELSAAPVVPLRYLVSFNPRPTLNAGGDAVYLPMEAISEFGPVDTSRRRPIADLRQGYSYVANGDVAFAKVTPCFENGKGFVARDLPAGQAFATTEVTVMRPSAEIEADYLGWVLQSSHFLKQGESHMTGSGGLRRVPESFVGSYSIPLPDRRMQRDVAGFLARETARIDTLIDEQQLLIEMLHERRRALRVHVALHGTAPAEEIKSPLRWASQLPASWRVVPLTSVAQLESGHTPSRSREDWWTDCYIPWVSLHDVGTMRGIKYLHDTKQRISDAGLANSSARLLPARTVVLSRDATVGRAAIMGVPMATSQHFAAWVCGPLLDPEYLWVLFTDAMQPFFDSFQNGSTIRTIGMGDLKAFRIPLPPLDEQRRIVEHLDEETPKINTLITETERFIELARERRAALITAAVMGQIDVREMA
ncbi:restriction endonuclease subunit S [Saccharothrix longispora]|uniref:Type I restriction enzyme S subunit n=1 Tax=Saccharothrix longispora TaxID=33920 RepID=A0ABU1Q665_9PSEU|nr:restriction endonuclease subunit S [Saccharothrix longispora]MDR6598376.1 type I restriction enzyme S subunit [Saccharothrix longispora]